MRSLQPPLESAVLFQTAAAVFGGTQLTNGPERTAAQRFQMNFRYQSGFVLKNELKMNRYATDVNRFRLPLWWRSIQGVC